MKYFLLLTLCFLPLLVHAQSSVDTTFTWQSYARTGKTRIQLYPNPTSEERPVTIIIQELAENRGPSIVQDLSYLVEEIGRAYSIDPATVYWVLHWGSFSFPKASTSKKELFLRATFKRTKSGQLGYPSWRVIGRAEVEELTDRLFY